MEESTELIPAIHPNMSLWDIVSVIVASVDGRLELTDDQNFQISTMIRTKVDNCVDFHAAVNSEIERHNAFAKKHLDHSKSLQKKLERFEDYIRNVMISAQLEKLPGEQYQMSLSNPPGSLEIDSAEPTEDDFKHMERFVTKKVTYAWNKREIKKAIDEGNYPLGNAEIVKNRKVKFDIKKGLSK